MGSKDPFRHLKHKLWPKEKTGIKLAIWLPTTKSQKSTQFPRMQMVCNILLKSSRRGLEPWFVPHLDRRSAHKVTGPQSHGSLILEILGLPFGSFETKCHLDVGLVERHIVYYKGEDGGFPQVWAMVNLVNPICSWFIITVIVLKLCINQLVVWFVQIHVSD
jgi:hypothetical protein